jgi:DNA invertase Pin-like site-specific DNA recombinase
MKTICYMRVSSPKTNGRSRQKTDSQKLALKSYCRLQQIKRPLFIEDHASGRNQDRQGFQQVMEACRANKCQQLIVWKLDRLGRSMIETTKTIQELLSLNVRIDVTTQGLTFDDSPYSIFLIQLFAALAELESNHASERIKSGLAVARAKGKKLGRPLDQKKRTKLLRWNKAKIPVKTQAKRLGISSASVYAMRSRMQLNLGSKAS